MRLLFAVTLCTFAVMPVRAHRLDEYLQGTILSVEKNRLQIEMTLTPGVSVVPVLIQLIDTNADGLLSQEEQRAYAQRVLHDLSLTIDGTRLAPHSISLLFPTMEEIKQGDGEIHLDFSADLPDGRRNRELVLEDHHLSGIGVYQVNCLVPRDPAIRIQAQRRNFSQSVYRLDYVQADARSGLSTVTLWAAGCGWLGLITIVRLRRARYF